MWTVTKIRADYEGWWLFDNWKDQIIEYYNFETYNEMINKYIELIELSKDKYDNHLVGKHNIHAFFNNCDLKFCEDCDEDLQIFYSFIVLKNNEVYYNLPLY
ncbi:regulatory protein MsaA [Staphylococcus sp. Marseille-Q5304]|uniref:regulatory protein MsaA n=1 Tax=Staphylococcus sp. Marseille-Q5304 TaxID=2942200 RepID=UPI0020747CD8|nr:regulatory protein MsaA [Staphylococcus sp. Marseille-Q5304]